MSSSCRRLLTQSAGLSSRINRPPLVRDGDTTAPALPAYYPSLLVMPVADMIGSIDSIDGLIDVDGGAGVDDLNIDDSRNTADKAATLTQNSLRGLNLPGGVDYEGLEDLNLWLGNGADVLFIDSTHAGSTRVYAGDGNATTNERDDSIVSFIKNLQI